MLLSVITNSAVYKHPESYVLARNTYYVESFNNNMNIFQDKRISFSDSQYLARSQLAVCHWNENVDRPFTSVWNPRRAEAPRSRKGKKNYKAPIYHYRDSTWKRFINNIFQ
ncbi:hypothetical protein KP79_PYT08432 [Mizuhopecten yessoensis]|uniref:Uncharacterized protein n=1 Tax=Mizuhopecten yessoensis TaxID=6573 RepID=A0A210PY40_MIZYE|nr:hypothetical protein KP79_PYT08432 [Mizuhopecten yessoensis]